MPPVNKKAEELEAVIKLLPPGADVVNARLTLGALSVLWDHAPVGLPAALKAFGINAVRLVVKAVAETMREPEFAQRFNPRHALALAAMQGKEAKREAIYEVLLRLWVEAGGELTLGGTETGSACVNYLVAAIEAITGNEMTVSGARKIVRRHRGRGSLKR